MHKNRNSRTPPPRWVALNFPSQADVLISSLTCRHPINLWIVLGKVLGKPVGVSASKNKDVNVQLVNGSVQFWVPSIRLMDRSRYHPPLPTGSWAGSNYIVSGDGRVGFRNKELATRYASIRFLIDNFDDGLKPFVIGLLKKPEMEFKPQRLHVSTRRRDPLKMIILYDNDHRLIEPMAICLELKKRQGLFALVDDFGRILRDSSIRFFLDS